MVNVFIFHLNSIFMSLISISIWNPQMFDINCSFEFWELWLMSISFLSLSLSMIPVCFHIRVLHARSSVCRQRGGKSLNDWISKSQLFKKGSSMQNDSFIFRSLSLSIRIFVCPFGVCVYILFSVWLDLWISLW